MATCCRGSRFLTSSAAKSSATGVLGDLRSGRPCLDRAWKFSVEEEAQSKSSGASNHRYLLPSLVSIPGVDLLAGFIPGNSVSLLNYPLELFLAAVDLGEVVVGQFPHCCFTAPFTCFQFPSTRFQSIAASFCSNLERYAWPFCSRSGHRSPPRPTAPPLAGAGWNAEVRGTFVVERRGPDEAEGHRARPRRRVGVQIQADNPGG